MYDIISYTSSPFFVTGLSFGGWPDKGLFRCPAQAFLLGQGCSNATEPFAVDPEHVHSAGRRTGAQSPSKAASQNGKCLSLSLIFILDFHTDFKLILYVYS